MSTEPESDAAKAPPWPPAEPNVSASLTPPPIAPDVIPAPAAPGVAVTDVFIFLTIVAWAAVFVVGLIQYTDFKEATDSFSISAPQISQLADEVMVTLIPWVIGAVGITATAVVIGLRQIASEATSRVR